MKLEELNKFITQSINEIKNGIDLFNDNPHGFRASIPEYIDFEVYIDEFSTNHKFRIYMNFYPNYRE